MKFAWIIVTCGLLLMWFHLLTSIDFLEAKIVPCDLDSIDRFVAVFNLDGQSAS